MAETSNYDRTYLDCLQPFKINKDTLIYLTNNNDHPTTNSVHLIYQNGNSDAPESEEDDQDLKVREEGVQDGQNTVQEIEKANFVFGEIDYEKM